MLSLDYLLSLMFNFVIQYLVIGDLIINNDDNNKQNILLYRKSELRYISPIILEILFI